MRHARPIALLLAIAAPGLLAACAGAPDPNLRELSYADQPRIELDVAQVEIEQDYFPPLKEPNVDHEFPTHPVVALKRWVNDRLDPDGAKNIARLTIRDASAVREVYETDTGLVGMVMTEPGERIDAKIDVMLEILDEKGAVLASASARSERSQTLPEGVSWEDREEAYFTMSKALMDDINVSLERNIREHFGQYLL